MEESQTAAPFLTKTYEMVDDPITNPLVSWSESGRSFVVWNPLEFARDLLPVYFKHNNFCSFVRQLNTYGFKKIDAERWEFANEGFVRGKRYTLKTIKRQKPIHSHSFTKTNQQGSSRESERQVLEGRIQRLKRDKNLLKLEVQRRGGENHASKVYVESLTERLIKLEHRQMQLMNLFAQLLNKPSAQLAVYSTNKKRRLILFDMNGSGGTSTSTSNDNGGRLSEERIEKMEASLNYGSALVYSSGETFVEKVHDLGVVPQLSVEETEEEEANGGNGGCGGGTTRASSPTPQALKDSSSTSTTSVGVNDVFWEQFFTETPNPTTTTPS